MEKFVVIDLETTGHSPTKGDKIIEIGLVVIEGDQIAETRSALFNPRMSIPPFISTLTGIHNEDIKDAPLFQEKADEIVHMFQNSYLIAHNVPFDMGFLNAELENNGLKPLSNPVIDTVELSRIFFPQAPSYKLGQLAEYLEIQHDEPHRALSDAYVTAKLFLKLKEKIRSLPIETIQHLLLLADKLKSDLYPFLNNRKKQLIHSPMDRDDIEVFNGLAFRKVLEFEELSDRPLPLTYGEYLDNIYENKMEKYYKNYERRIGQEEMSAFIYDCFQDKKHALIEAQTGTGKTLAYLIPAIYEAVLKNDRILISTYTTQLQEQLLNEEIPLLQKLVDFPINVALIKGKSHYISLEKFYYELNNDLYDNYDIVLTKAMILVWLTETKTGDIDEIQLPSSGYLFYKRISTEAEGERDPSSPWFHRSFYQKAKTRAKQADIVITNHALLCTDMFNNYQLLPSYKKVIIDEAHHFDVTASHYYGLKLDSKSIHYTLNQLSQLEVTFENNTTSHQDQWNEILINTKYEVDEFFQALYHYVANQYNQNKGISDIGRLQYPLSETEDNNWQVLKEMASRVTFRFRDLIHQLSLLEEMFSGQGFMEKHAKEDVDRYIKIFQQYLDGIEQIFLVESELKQVKWIEIDTKSNHNVVFLYCEPTDISTLLFEDFFSKKESVILTSATLTVNESFSYFQDRLGLEEDQVVNKKITSPFSYSNQVQLLIPNDFPKVEYKNDDNFIVATSEAILSLAEVTEGRMLVLFTSYEMLKQTYSLLRESMNHDTFTLIAQGITSGSRTRLKKKFQTYEKAILLGTNSFWEGVDIPGKALSSLVIVRLPFQPPNHPLYEAKASYLKEQGKNPFMELALPNAVIKFKQGFGRLIRSKTDRGIVFVCDARIKTARYGKYFIQSIPEAPVSYESTRNLIEKARAWF